MKNQGWPGAPHESGWSRLSAEQKASVIGAGILIVLLGLLTLIGATGHFPGHPAGSSASPAASSRPQSAAVR
jgi:hypothetical protein